MLPLTPNPMPTAGRPEGEVNRTSFHYQWLLLSCFRSPPDPMPTAGRPEGEVNRTAGNAIGFLLLSCFRSPPAPCRKQAGLKGRSTHFVSLPIVNLYIIVLLPQTPSPMPTAGRPEGEFNRTSGNAISYYYCLASAHPQTPWITIQLQDFDFDNYCQRN